MMKGKKLQPRILYSAGLSFRCDREIKSFPDKLRESNATKPALQQILKEVLSLGRKYKRRKRSDKK